MSRIIVAGAGHGGLSAAAKLSEAGHSVTVYEKEKEADIGHDWQDRFTFSVLCETLGISEKDLPDSIWNYRGDCAFISPAKNKRIAITYSDVERQKIMWRKPLVRMLTEHAKACGTEFHFETPVLAPLISGRRITGIRTADREIEADLVIDAAGVFSPLRTKLPKYFFIESQPKRGDIFYAYRAYYKKTIDVIPEYPFEIYLRHNGDQGLSWFYTDDNAVDILIGRIDPLSQTCTNKLVDEFRKEHPWFNEEIIHGGQNAYIPVRRPLTLMVADGYAAIGDSAFMTTPMNGMGIDLSLLAGNLLADTVLHAKTNRYTADVLWEYNRDFHMLYGCTAAKNAGLKNALLSLPSQGVDFLFEQDVIQASDLSGAGKNTDLISLLGKLTRGLHNPPYFAAVLKGLMRGSKASGIYQTPPLCYDLQQIQQWDQKIRALDIIVPKL